MWKTVYTKQAQKDAKKLSAAGLRSKAEKLLKILQENPGRNRHLLKNLSEIWTELIPDGLIFSIV